MFSCQFLSLFTETGEGRSALFRRIRIVATHSIGSIEPVAAPPLPPRAHGIRRRTGFVAQTCGLHPLSLAPLGAHATTKSRLQAHPPHSIANFPHEKRSDDLYPSPDHYLISYEYQFFSSRTRPSPMAADHRRCGNRPCSRHFQLQV